MSTAQPNFHRGIVKQVLSGDNVIIRGQPKGGPPPERQLALSNIIAPRLGRRAKPNVEGSLETKDEPWAWEAREFLRKKLIGKEVSFAVEYKVPGSGREYGMIYLGKESNLENVTESIVAEGLVEVRRVGIKPTDEEQQRLIQLEDAAKAAGKGKWSAGTGSDHIRDVKWTIENLRHFVDSHHGKPIDAIIEQVRDGSTVRATLLPTFEYVTVMLSGIKSPMFKLDGSEVKPEPFAEEAKYFTESRLLQREVKIILEGVSNQNFLGSVIHPAGNIAELLLRDGFANCVDWSMGIVTQGANMLRQAEMFAKEKNLRIWKDHKPSVSAGIDIKNKYLTGKVVEIVNGDALVVKTAEGTYKKIFFASVRPPRMETSEDKKEGKPEEQKRDPKQRVRPLYDIPYMFEAREFLRKRLIGKKVNIQVDYIQPPAQNFPEKCCCTVTIGDVNIAETLVSKGLARVIRYRQDDDQRSAFYDDLLAAESRAQKMNKGVHSKKEPPIHRVADISGDVPKAKQFLPFLQRAGRSEAVVEFVASGSRLRLYIPRETCLITLLLAGIDCPRGSRPGANNTTIPGDKYGEEALMYTKELCLQREVEVEVESMDKGGNFIGWLFVDGVNVSVGLVEEGLAKIHYTATRSNFYKTLLTAEDNAKQKKLNVWSGHEEPKEKVEVDEGPVERQVNQKTVLVTEVSEGLHFFAQSVENGPQLEKLMEQLRADLEANPPLQGSYVPKKGDLCAAQFSVDNEWYRAKVESVDKNNGIKVLFIDYGNRETTTQSRVAPLPTTFHGLPPQAQEYALACVSLPEDEEAKNDALDALNNDIANMQLLLNVEYKGQGFDYVTLQFSDSKEDVAQGLITEGFVLAENRKEKRLSKLVSEYSKAQDKAKAARVNLWRYGDFMGDDAKEFGYTR